MASGECDRGLVLAHLLISRRLRPPLLVARDLLCDLGETSVDSAVKAFNRRGRRVREEVGRQNNPGYCTSPPINFASAVTL